MAYSKVQLQALAGTPVFLKEQLTFHYEYAEQVASGEIESWETGTGTGGVERAVSKLVTTLSTINPYCQSYKYSDIWRLGFSYSYSTDTITMSFIISEGTHIYWDFEWEIWYKDWEQDTIYTTKEEFFLADQPASDIFDDGIIWYNSSLSTILNSQLLNFIEYNCDYSCHITFQDTEETTNNTVVYQDEYIRNNTVPTYTGEIPTKDGYRFTGWLPEIIEDPIIEDTIYVAQFELVEDTSLKATFNNYDGTKFDKVSFESGDKPEKPTTNPVRPDNKTAPNKKIKYEFTGWYPEIKEEVENITYTAQYKEITYYLPMWKIKT